MSKKKYLEVEEELRTVHEDFLNSSLVKLMAELQGFQDDYPDHQSLRLQVNYEDGYDATITLIGTRLETDKERNKRLAYARTVRRARAQAKATAEAIELALYKKLKAKYA